MMLLDIEYKGAYGSEPAAQMATREKQVKEIPPTSGKCMPKLSLARLARHLPLSSSPSPVVKIFKRGFLQGIPPGSRSLPVVRAVDYFYGRCEGPTFRNAGMAWALAGLPVTG